MGRKQLPIPEHFTLESFLEQKKQGLSSAYIAEKEQVAERTIYKWASELGYDKSMHPHIRRTQPPSWFTKEWYEGKIAAGFYKALIHRTYFPYCSEEMFRRFIKEVGAELPKKRKKKMPPKGFSLERYEQMRKEGLNMEEVGEVYGVCIKTLRRWLKELGACD